ncbi:hypothetical protein HF569_03455 [Lactobacillus sp. ZJLC3-7]|nr:hypothetical protein [Levilactobacillus tujiorum]
MFNSSKCFYMSNIIVLLVIVFYDVKLYTYNKILKRIWDSYNNIIQGSFEVMQADGYNSYLLWGIAFVGLMILMVILIWKYFSMQSVISKLILTIIHIGLFIVTIYLLCNPILFAFATVGMVGGIYIATQG